MDIKQVQKLLKYILGNDWIPEKIYEDIKTYNIDKKDVSGYIEYKKFTNKIITYKIKENLVIKPLNSKEDTQNFGVKLKNKLLEKIRKMFDEYQNYDTNIILADIVTPKYFDDINNIEKFNNELIFYINHLEVSLGKEYILLMKLDKKWLIFDLKNHTCDFI